MEGGGDELGGRGGIFVKLWMYKLTFNRFNELVRNFPYVVKGIRVVSILLLQRERWGRRVEPRLRPQNTPTLKTTISLHQEDTLYVCAYYKYKGMTNRSVQKQTSVISVCQAVVHLPRSRIRSVPGGQRSDRCVRSSQTSPVTSHRG